MRSMQISPSACLKPCHSFQTQCKLAQLLGCPDLIVVLRELFLWPAKATLWPHIFCFHLQSLSWWLQLIKQLWVTILYTAYNDLLKCVKKYWDLHFNKNLNCWYSEFTDSPEVYFQVTDSIFGSMVFAAGLSKGPFTWGMSDSGDMNVNIFWMGWLIKTNENEVFLENR